MRFLRLKLNNAEHFLKKFGSGSVHKLNEIIVVPKRKQTSIMVEYHFVLSYLK